MKIGIFALQGAFFEHRNHLERLGAEVVEIRRRSHFTESFDGVILPGGESTVQGKLLREEGLLLPVKRALEEGLPAFGTCAGMILLAEELSNDDNVYFGLLRARVRRNAYGRQLGSFRTELDLKGVGRYPAVFIRAPYVEETWGDCIPLASVDSNVVAVRQSNLLATAFHPELTEDLRVHGYFLDMIRGKV